MDQIYTRIYLFLGREPDCDTEGGEIENWRDASPQPTEEELLGVGQEAVDARIAEIFTGGF